MRWNCDGDDGSRVSGRKRRSLVFYSILGKFIMKIQKTAWMKTIIQKYLFGGGVSFP